ncbi:MAG: helix-turn-helix transcriptional regulator [Clostridia bacterium]|nr:helix-turn-helix transcriptional regulator [Clostridia bacterium]
MNFQEQLKQARKAAGLTQAQVAAALRVDKSTYCGYETGKRKPDVQKLKQIAAILGTTGDALLGTLPSSSDDISESEYVLLTKYRALDPQGRQTVDAVLELAYRQLGCNS